MGMNFKNYLLQELIKTDLNNVERLREIRIQAQCSIKADELRDKLNKKLEENCFEIDEEAVELSSKLDVFIVKMQEFKLKEIERGNVKAW